MNYCHLGEDGAYYISSGITKNRRLRSLMIAGNNIADAGLTQIADSITFGSFLIEHLDLSNNTITDDGAMYFAKQLTQNKSFLTLNLKQNQIGRDGGVALREAVAKHPYLIRFYLEQNAVQVRDIEEIDRALKKNREERAKKRMPSY